MSTVDSVVALRQQFLHRVDHRDRVALGAEYPFHDGDGELFAAADNSRVHAVRALPQQRNTVQHLLELRELLIDHALQAIVFKARQRLRRAAQQIGKDPLGVADIRQNVRPATVLSIIATRWLVIFAGRTRPWLPVPDARYSP